MIRTLISLQTITLLLLIGFAAGSLAVSVQIGANLERCWTLLNTASGRGRNGAGLPSEAPAALATTKERNRDYGQEQSQRLFDMLGCGIPNSAGQVADDGETVRQPRGCATVQARPAHLLSRRSHPGIARAVAASLIPTEADCPDHAKVEDIDAVDNELSDEDRAISLGQYFSLPRPPGHLACSGSKLAKRLIPSFAKEWDPLRRFGTAMFYFRWRESRCGRDQRWRITGKAGEQGEYRITPIFVAEVKRICGYEIDVFDNESCRQGITAWLTYWCPRVFKGQATVADVYELYRRGPKGYRKWRKTHPER